MSISSRAAAIPVLLLALASCGWATSFTITPTFDSTITSLPDASTVEATINQVIGVYESTFANPIDVNITFSNSSSISLGESNYNQYVITYSQFLSAFTANASGANDTLALEYLPDTTNNPVTNEANMFIKPGQRRGAWHQPGTGRRYERRDSDRESRSDNTTGNGTQTGSYNLVSVVEPKLTKCSGSVRIWISPRDTIRHTNLTSHRKTSTAMPRTALAVIRFPR